KVKRVLEDYSNSNFSVADISKKPGTRNPSAPFTTSTLQQEASNRLGYSPRQTMQLAQRLYESGHITYMRTDSLNLSKQSLAQAASYIEKNFGKDYHQFRTFKAKTSGAQEAHEAIRPTDIAKLEAGADQQAKKLYGLIWRRTLASQMAPAALERTTVSIAASDSSEKLVAKGEIVTFDGYLKVYGRSRDDILLPKLSKGDPLQLISAEAVESLSRGPARYTEASLVKQLEEMGIGRPSTYASTLTTIQSRGYVERGDVEGEDRQVTKLSLIDGRLSETIETISYGKDSNKLVPTDTGLVVTDFLTKHFAEVMDYDFTRRIEDELDQVAEDHKPGVEVLDDFYKPFHKLVEKSADVSRAEASQARHIGDDPKSGRPIYARFGRYGPMLQMGEKDDEAKPEFAPMPSGAKIETVTLEQALEMFKLPRLVGTTDDGQEITANIGRFGPYVKIGSLFVSIKPEDPHTITLDKAKELYADKLKKEAEKNIADFGSIKVLNGRFGPYVTDGKKNAKIPKDTDPKSLDEAAAKELLDKAPASKKRRVIRRKK
ncbi:MAG TPA: DNA topoisomerase, partial [Candidatus Saccharimonadales bacterium]|nr:DNA topoisomerase [Candidatus Saccharimonadales bacterium]